MRRQNARELYDTMRASLWALNKKDSDDVSLFAFHDEIKAAAFPGQPMTVFALKQSPEP